MKPKIKFLMALALFSAIIMSCEKKDNTGDSIPAVRLETSALEVEAAGGPFAVKYNVENPSENASVEAVAADDWIRNVSAQVPGIISFDVDPNESASPRETVLTLRYEGAEDCTLKVMQKPGISFSLGFDVDGNAVLMSVEPSDKDTYYYFDVVNKADLDADDPESLRKYCQEQLTLIWQGYESWGYTVEEALEDFCSKGDASFRFPDLVEESDYYGFAYAVNDKGEISSEIAYDVFRTEKVQPSDNVLTIEVTDITAETAVLSITPSNDDQYTFLVMFADDFAGMADEEIIMMLLDGFELQFVTGKIENEVVSGLEPGMNFVVYAFGCQGGQATTGLFKKEFSTPAE